MSGFVKCRICRAHEYPTRDGLISHLASHTAQVLAEELVSALEREAAAQRAVSAARRLCRKHRFPTEEAAMQALLRGWQRRSPQRREIRAYKCDQCPDPTWHLTSRPLLADLDADGVAS